ncbi:FAD-dependent oxidoreductase [Kordia sp. YSTF-M3]|uniref:FAD-dependent oxidoreductase n=1 Tax=Kordia aestuariivivens TaxID=2759037 RepID=A0ABR7QD92_9FLAO|nr:FAD-dependent oxidoreductase [Kordia aestuariivivens]MBC8756383.1 FAD-dependent oxidoreductase [Kordia aestuariivivens]
MKKEVVIIGGGIIGLCCAYYLQQDGHQVTIVDKSDISRGASFVNAGYITPSHFIPLAAPGMITKGLKWMLNSSSPFYVKPRLDADFLKWSWLFKKSATAKHVEQSIPVIKDINLLGRELYAELKKSNDFDFHFERKGLLMCYQTEKAGEEEWNIGERAIQEGLNVQHLTKEEVKKFEPNVDFNIKGAVFYDSDAHMTPNDFMKQMIAFLKTKGVLFYTNEAITNLAVSNDKIVSVQTSKRTLKADEFVLSAGTWSSVLAKKLQINIPLQAGKGYSINVTEDTGISMPAILVEAKVAVTPMRGFTRFAGTMEIGGINHDMNPKRVKAVANTAEGFYNGLQIPKSAIDAATCGLRPCSPDGLPYIGKTENYKNLTIATGHAMMGWSLGPATGKLVSELISERKTSMRLDGFEVGRFSF